MIEILPIMLCSRFLTTCGLSTVVINLCLFIFFQLFWKIQKETKKQEISSPNMDEVILWNHLQIYLNSGIQEQMWSSNLYIAQLRHQQFLDHKQILDKGISLCSRVSSHPHGQSWTDKFAWFCLHFKAQLRYEP